MQTLPEMEEWISKLCDWLGDCLIRLHEFTTLEKVELILCASDLGLESTQIDLCIDELGVDEEKPPPEEDSLFYSLARQLALLKFERRSDVRRKFLDRWINEQGFRGHSIITISFIFSLGLEQLEFIEPHIEKYIKSWHRKHSFARSDRFAAWSCYCLILAGHHEEASRRAGKLLEKREPNGSWSYELRRTIGCCYPLALAGLVKPVELAPTLRYIQERLTLGYTGDVATNSQALKTIAALSLLPEENRKRLHSLIQGQGSIFLSHTSEDKPFVRRLAQDLKAHGITVWLDEAELLPGDRLFEKIEAAVEEMQYLGVILSPRSVASSWVKEELRMAQILNLSQRDVKILPILFEYCEVPLSLRGLFWADFTQDYDAGLSKILRRLLPGLVIENGHSTRPNRPLRGAHDLRRSQDLHDIKLAQESADEPRESPGR